MPNGGPVSRKVKGSPDVGRRMELVTTPRERLRSVAFALFTDPSGPNIMLGILASAALQAAIGMVPITWPAVAAVAWVASVVTYAYVDEVKQRIEAERERLLEPESQFYGIE